MIKKKRPGILHFFESEQFCQAIVIQFPDLCLLRIAFFFAGSQNPAVFIDPEIIDKTIRFQPSGSSIAIATAGNSTAQGARAQTAKYAENNIQKFNLFYSGDGYYRIVNKKTGYCVTNDGDRIVSMRAWANKDTQRWKLVWNGNGTGLYSGTYRIICKADNTVLTIDGTVNSLKDIKADPWRGLRQQQWRLTNAG